MDFNEYQNLCKTTDLGNKGGRSLLKPDWMYYVLGIGDESGELMGKIKKLFRDHGGYYENSEFKKMLTLELGDIFWYIARLADKFDIKLDDVAKANVDKLQSRKERGKLQGDGDLR